jgi:hypothetical protein
VDIFGGFLMAAAAWALGLVVMFYVIKLAVRIAIVEAYEEMGLVRAKGYEPVRHVPQASEVDAGEWFEE